MTSESRLHRALGRLTLACVAACAFACRAQSSSYKVIARDQRSPDQMLANASAIPLRKFSLNRFVVIGGRRDFWMVTQLKELSPYLIIGDQFTTPHVAIVDTRTWKIVSRAGAHGEEENQLLDAQSIDPVPGTRKLTVYDSRRVRLSTLNLDQNGVASVESQSALPAELPYPTLQVVNAPRGYITGGGYSQIGIARLDTAARAVTHVTIPLPFPAGVVSRDMARQAMNWRALGIAPNSRRLVAAYQHASRLDFYDADGGFRGAVTGPEAITVGDSLVTPDAPLRWQTSAQLAYVDVTATDRYVYALFRGCIKKGASDALRVHVFDWNGTFIHELALDNGVYRIAVLGDSLLVGAGWTPYPSLGVWRLPTAMQVAVARGRAP